MNVRRVDVLVACVVVAGATVLAQARLNLGGTWVIDREKTAAKSAARPDSRGTLPAAGMAAGARSGGMAAVGQGTPPEWTLTQTAAALTMERALPAGTTQKYVYKFDGSESVNVNGRTTLKTKSRWEGARLVTEGTQSVSTDQGTIAGTFKEIRWLDKDGSMVVETTRAMDQNPPVTSTQVLVKKAQ